MARSFWFDSCQVGTVATDAQALGYTGNSTAPAYTATGGPFNDRYLLGLGSTRAQGINAASVADGIWVKIRSGFTASTVFQGLDGASAQWTLRINASGLMEVRTGGTGGTVLGTSVVALSLGAWSFVEVEINVNSSGHYEVWIDGTSVLSGSGNTRGGTANNYVTNILNGGNSNVNNTDYSALYNIGDTAASTATRLGPVKPYLLVATGDGNATAWTANTGTRWQAIDEVPTNDGDTTYISDNTPGDKNTIDITDTVAGLGTIYGLAHYYWARRDDAGPHTMRAYLRDTAGPTEQVEATETLTASYVGHPYFREYSPFTGGSTRWTTSEVDGLRLGVELVS
jgi:hypothetical protein